MSDHVTEIPKTRTISTIDCGRFPVRRVYCIGRNFAAHAVEMGHDPDRESPFFFHKNTDNLDASGEFPYPPKSSDVHHEIELLVGLKSGGTNIPLNEALDHVWGYGVSLDMTRRDLRGQAQKMGRRGRSAKHSNSPGRLVLCCLRRKSGILIKVALPCLSTTSFDRKAT